MTGEELVADLTGARHDEIDAASAALISRSGIELQDFDLGTAFGEDAERLLEPLRAAPPDDFTYWVLAANLAFAAARWEESADAFRRAEQLGGPGQEIALNRAMALARAGRTEEAILELRRAASGPTGAIADRATAELERIASP